MRVGLQGNPRKQTNKAHQKRRPHLNPKEDHKESHFHPSRGAPMKLKTTHMCAQNSKQNVGQQQEKKLIKHAGQKCSTNEQRSLKNPRTTVTTCEEPEDPTEGGKEVGRLAEKQLSSSAKFATGSRSTQGKTQARCTQFHGGNATWQCKTKSAATKSAEEWKRTLIALVCSR